MSWKMRRGQLSTKIARQHAYFSRGILVAIASTLLSICTASAQGVPYYVTVTLHEAKSLTNADGGPGNDDDIYWYVEMTTDGGANTKQCETLRNHTDGKTHIAPNWVCPLIFDTALNALLPQVDILISLYEHDVGTPSTIFDTGADDKFDIRGGADKDIRLTFDPNNGRMRVANALDSEKLQRFNTFACAFGRISSRGYSGDDQASIIFSVSGAFSDTGDSDGDGLNDSIEQCGVDSDADGVVDVDLPAMGADPLRKDVFLEIDWTANLNTTVGQPHSHSPWLPALVAAWNHFDRAPVTNVSRPGGPETRSGIALHIDVGDLYAGYNLDFNGDGTSELNLDLDGDSVPDTAIGPDGNIDLDRDGIVDIGNLGGGNRICGGLPCDRLAQTGEISQVTRFAAILMRSSNFNPNRDNIFRYVLFGHTVSSPALNVPALGINWPAVDPCEILGIAPFGGASVGSGFDVVVTAAVNAGCPGPNPGPGIVEPRVLTLGFVGPEGVGVDGRISEHTAVLMHELGHNLGLGHGGGDSINHKPNYHSVMNYTYSCTLFCGRMVDVDGDGIGDILAQDIDGLPGFDSADFFYSSNVLPTLREGVLNEPSGVGESVPYMIMFGPTEIDLDGDGACDQYCQPLPPFPTLFFNPPPLPPMVGDAVGPVDWSRGDRGAGDPDGNGVFDSDVGVNRVITLPLSNTPTDINALTDFPFTVGMGAPLQGFNDYQLLVRNGFKNVNSPGTGIRRKDIVRIRSSPKRIKLFQDKNYAEARCSESSKIKFDEFSVGDALVGQFAPTLTFTTSSGRHPLISKPSVGTESEPHSLSTDNSDELVIKFQTPQRIVAFHVGRGEEADTRDDLIGIRAFDVEGLPMGVETMVPNIGHRGGVNNFAAISAIVTDQLISRIGISYFRGRVRDKIHIDNLTFCASEKPMENMINTTPKPVRFGEYELQLHVDILRLQEKAVGDGHKHVTMSQIRVDNVPFRLNDEKKLAHFENNFAEGSVVRVEAFPSLAEGNTTYRFLKWQTAAGVSFPNGQRNVTLRMLRDARLEAVYIP